MKSHDLTSERRLVWGFSILLATSLFAAGCSLTSEKRAYLTVPEVWADVQSLEGTQVRVRGYTFFSVMQSLVLCEPSRCDCNESLGSLILIEAAPPPDNLNKIADMARISISSTSLLCGGDECSMNCSPFDPTASREFELVGSLKVEYDNPILTDLDLQASRQRVGDAWVAIPTGILPFRCGSSLTRLKQSRIPRPSHPPN